MKLKNNLFHYCEIDNLDSVTSSINYANNCCLISEGIRIINTIIVDYPDKTRYHCGYDVLQKTAQSFIFIEEKIIFLTRPPRDWKKFLNKQRIEGCCHCL